MICFSIPIADVEKKKKELAAHKVDSETEISGYYQVEKQIGVLKEAVKNVITKPQHLVPFLQAGRLLHVSYFLMYIVRASVKHWVNVVPMKNTSQKVSKSM